MTDENVPQSYIDWGTQSRDDQLWNLDCSVTLMHTTLMGKGELIGDHHTPKLSV